MHSFELGHDAFNSGSMMAPTHAFQQAPNDADFVALQAAYRPFSGLARGHHLAESLRQRQKGYVSLARLIVTRQVFSFAWHDDFWVPVFQMDLLQGAVRPQPQSVVAELVDVMDGWSLAVWFASGNCQLSHESPVSCLAQHPTAVVQAARMQRVALTA
jgi:hypothetical protein